MRPSCWSSTSLSWLAVSYLPVASVSSLGISMCLFFLLYSFRASLFSPFTFASEFSIRFIRLTDSTPAVIMALSTVHATMLAAVINTCSRAVERTILRSTK